jgi:glycerol-3-phosphate dehydrogenase
MPAEFFAAELKNDGVVVRYVAAGTQNEVLARVVVNAAGAWANEVADRISPALGVPAIELVQGTHIIVPGQLQQGIYYVESPRDGRAVFVMPWKGSTLVGTTETRFRGDPDRVEPHAVEKHYLLSVLKRYFPRHGGLHARDLIGAFAGLRVLPAGSGHAFHRSRETALVADRDDRPRVLGIYGGKLTGWRATAGHVMKRIAPSLPARRTVADTATLKLT